MGKRKLTPLIEDYKVQGERAGLAKFSKAHLAGKKWR